jgi:CBS domain-containing protein
VEYVTLQYENLNEKPALLGQPGIHFGLALTNNTPVTVFGDYAEHCSFVLFMTTTPGQSGGVFDSNTFRRIRQFRALFPGKKIHVDGGINAEVSFILRNMGIYTSVIGSYLFKGEFIGSAMMKLRSADVHSHYRVKDFMLQIDEIPVSPSEGADFKRILQSIEDYRMGFTMLASKEGKLEGIVSNADVRKGLLKNIQHLECLDIDSMINRNPVFVYDDMEVSDLLNTVKNLTFPVLFVPVVDRAKKIVGTIKFNNLIKGES